LSRGVLISVIAMGVLTGGLAGSAYGILNTRFFDEHGNSASPPGGERPESGVISQIDYGDETVNFLLLGVDESELLTDVIMVANLNMEDRKLNILQIPRDTYVGDDIVLTGKINAVYGSAKNGEANIDALIKIINEKFKLTVDHYATVTISGFIKIVNALGGVEVDVPVRIEYDSPSQGHVVIEPGLQRLYGESAEWFVRHRKSYVTGDIGRMGAQKQFMSVLFDMIFSVSKTQAATIAAGCISEITTDLTLSQVLEYYGMLSGISRSDIEFYMVPGDGVNAYYNGYAIYGVDKAELAEILNRYFRPRSADILPEDLPLVDVMEMKSFQSQANSAPQNPARDYPAPESSAAPVEIIDGGYSYWWNPPDDENPDGYYSENAASQPEAPPEEIAPFQPGESQEASSQPETTSVDGFAEPETTAPVSSENP
jgi:LCP family protein required for cell wall assembly